MAHALYYGNLRLIESAALMRDTQCSCELTHARADNMCTRRIRGGFAGPNTAASLRDNLSQSRKWEFDEAFLGIVEPKI